MAYAATALRSGKQIKDQGVWTTVNIEHVIEWAIYETIGLNRIDFSPKGEILDGKKVEQKLIVLLFCGQELQHSHFFLILLQVLDEVFDGIVLGAIFHAEYDPDVLGLLVGYACAYALVLLQGCKCSPL